MVSLFVDNQHVVQILAMLGIGAILVIAGCLLLGFLVELLDRFSSLGWVCKIGVLFLVVQLTMFGGAKHGGTNDVTNVDGTNQVEIVGGGGQSNLMSCAPRLAAPLGFASQRGIFGLEEGGAHHCPPPPLLSTSTATPPLLSTSSISFTDIARGYRLESVVTNDDISYAMPSEGVVRGTWHLTGAYEDVQKVSLVPHPSSSIPHPSSPIPHPFLFPLGTNLCSSLWTYTWGKVRSRLSGTGVSPVQGWPAQNGQDATTVATSLREATFGRWISSTCEISAVGAPMSAIPEMSRFWTAATSNDTYLMTWENFALGRLPVCTNISSLIPHPSSLVSAQLELSRNGDFITRSNNVMSVWRRVNPDDWDDDGIPNEDDDDPLCRAVGETYFGPHQDLSVIINSNAYCWVDVVVPHVNARVTFVGNGHCRLPDPSFIAEAGMTNRVVILIGKEYHVRCDMPFEIISQSDAEIGVWEESPTDKTICWPVEIEAWEGNGNSFRMHVVPNRVGGGFTWTNVCCSVSGSGYAFTYGCDKDCLCTGCATSGYLEYEEFRKGCHGGSCGCSSSGEWVEYGDPDEAPDPASVSVEFSKSVVLFEDAYTNSYGRPVLGQSTVTRLTCIAYGGKHGGDLTITPSGVDKLTRIAGAELPAGSVSVEPYQTRTYKVDYHGREPSEGKGDITVSAMLVENDTSENHSDEDALTAVRVKSHVNCMWIPWTSRKELGVGEIAYVFATPVDADLGLTVSGCVDDVTRWIYKAPQRAAIQTLSVSTSECSLPMTFQTFEPEGLLATDYGGIWGVPAGTAGNFSGTFTVYVMPTNVSLTAIEKREIGCVATDAAGIFATLEYQGWLDHTNHGAERWHGLNPGNRCIDEISFAVITNWGGNAASFTWPIPNVWRMKDASSEVTFPHDSGFNQRFEIDADGTSRIRKFHWIVERATNLTHSVRREN